jgi:hypothetical protein
MAAATATASARIALDFTLLSLTVPDFMNRLDKYYRIPAIRPDGSGTSSKASSEASS